LSAPEYETILSPTDFAAFSENEAAGNPSVTEPADLWDSDAMYNADKFEGDIANDVGYSMKLINLCSDKCKYRADFSSRRSK
jgi:hypothetical protein